MWTQECKSESKKICSKRRNNQKCSSAHKKQWNDNVLFVNQTIDDSF